MPFERAVVELQHFRRTDVSRPTVERITEAAGAAYVKVQEREVERLECEAPAPPAGSAKQFLSVDGADVQAGWGMSEMLVQVVSPNRAPLPADVRKWPDAVSEVQSMSELLRRKEESVDVLATRLLLRDNMMGADRHTDTDALLKQMHTLLRCSWLWRLRSCSSGLACWRVCPTRRIGNASSNCNRQ